MFTPDNLAGSVWVCIITGGLTTTERAIRMRRTVTTTRS